MLEPATITAAVEQLEQQMIEERRALHRRPELSGVEVETAAFIAQRMEQLGLAPVWVRHPVAAYYVLDTGRPGKTVALRADIDALKMPEDANNLKGPKQTVSEIEGLCHACGHDGHVAALLCAARVLCSHRDSLKGRVIFIFESAEELGPDNSYPFFVEMLKREQPDYIWGVHLYAGMPAGTVSVQAGPRMSGSGSFKLEILGRGGHASRPDQSVNPVLTAAEIACKLQSVIPLNIAPDEAAVLGITTIQGGQVWNIIPDTCDMIGTIRYFSDENYYKLTNGIRRVTDAICAANNCTVNYKSMPKLSQPVVNHPEACAIAEAAVDRIAPGARRAEPAWMASESFGNYLRVTKGLLAFVGIANPEVGSGAAHHNVKFDLDEAALALSAKCTVQFAADVLCGG